MKARSQPEAAGATIEPDSPEVRSRITLRLSFMRTQAIIETMHGQSPR